ncbi:hypothetical protein ACT453_35450, partial [Bacillus sp. D-CC]
MAEVKVFNDLDIELAQRTKDIVNAQRFNNRPAFKTLNLGWDLETGSIAVNYTFVEEPQSNDQPALYAWFDHFEVNTHSWYQLTAPYPLLIDTT